MPSFKLYEIEQEYQIKDLKNIDILSKVTIGEDDPQSVKKIIESGKKDHRNLRISPIKDLDAAIMNFEEQLRFQDNQSLWINNEKLILKEKNLLLIGKTERRMERLVELFLRSVADAKPVSFSDKKLWQIWKKIKSQNDNYQVKLHRLIIKNAFIESDKIVELNLHANDVSKLGVISELIKNSQRINAITFKIKGFYEGNKWSTIRLDRNGSLLIYGKHESHIIKQILVLLRQSL